MAHVLFHRPTVWASPIQCSTKVLARLTASRGHQVSYLQAPLDPVHLLRGRKGYLGVWRDSPRDEDGVRIVTPATPVPVRDIWPLSSLRAARMRYRLAVPPLHRTIPSPDLIWTTVPGSARALRHSFPKARLVFHIVDYYPAFRGDAVKPLERDDYAVADHVCTIGHTLRDYVVDGLGIPAAKVSVLGQGVEQEAYAPDLPEPKALAGLPRPRAVWTGVLEKGDTGLFDALAAGLAARGGSLVLIGPHAPWVDAIEARYPGTVRAVGAVAPRELPSWLVQCDLGVMLYDRARQDVYKGQNPLKLYEYAAAGLTIMSTPHDEYHHLMPPVLEIMTELDIDTALTRALDQEAGWRNRVDSFAKQHSWQAKVDVILSQFLETAAIKNTPIVPSDR